MSYNPANAMREKVCYGASYKGQCASFFFFPTEQVFFCVCDGRSKGSIPEGKRETTQARPTDCTKGLSVLEVFSY
jgi:hypothetical protein